MGMCSKCGLAWSSCLKSHRVIRVPARIIFPYHVTLHPILLDSSRLRLPVQTSEPARRLGYLSADIICSEKRTIFREGCSRDCGLRGSDNVQGQISWYGMVWYGMVWYSLFKSQKHASTLEPSTALLWILLPSLGQLRKITRRQATKISNSSC